jgi:hypothetical protein
MIRTAAVLFVLALGFVLTAAAQDFEVPGGPGKVYFKNR